MDPTAEPDPKRVRGSQDQIPCLRQSHAIPAFSCRGAESCPFDHRTVCIYGSRCRKMQEGNHCNEYYHPRGDCEFGAFCTNSSINHFLQWSHPCYIKECYRSTIPLLNGWLCTMHYKEVVATKKSTKPGFVRGRKGVYVPPSVEEETAAAAVADGKEEDQK